MNLSLGILFNSSEIPELSETFESRRNRAQVPCRRKPEPNPRPKKNNSSQHGAPSFKKIHSYIEENNKVLVFLGEGQHKIKKKAEQIACEKSLNKIEFQEDE